MRRSAPAALPVLLLLVAAAGALAVQVSPYLAGPELVRPTRADETGSERPAGRPVLPAVPAFVPPRIAGDAVVARNLFAMTRAPVPEEPAPEPVRAPAPAPVLHLRLTGIAMNASGGMAVFRHADGRDGALILSPGDRHDGWELRSLTERAAVLAQGSHVRRLELDFSGAR